MSERGDKMTNEVDRLELKNVYVNDYLEKLFYFCLKKTGNANEAEDLASDISLCVLSALEKGTKIDNFSAWIWRVARNRYAKWASSRREIRNSTYTDDVSDLDIPSDERFEDEIARTEEIKSLRRELAFISAEYRDIVVAYYIKQKRIPEISKTLSIPEGTVKSKLYRARKILKEGLSMAREFGKRIYDPEVISFISSGHQPSGVPEKAVKRKIPVNILCEANNNPSTAEELSIALGVALPYMEEEIKMLVDAELLKKLDDGKYITNFFIYPVECQNEINEALCNYCEDNCEKIWKLGEMAMEEAKRTVCNTDVLEETDAKMFFTLRLFDIILNNSGVNYKTFKRRDGGDWGFCGFEIGAKCRLDMQGFSNNVTDAKEGAAWGGYQATSLSEKFPKAKYTNMEGVPGSLPELTTMKLIADGISEGEMSKTDLDNVKSLMDKAYVVKVDGKLTINAVVFNSAFNYNEPYHFKNTYSTDDFKSVCEATRNMASEVYGIVERYSNPYLKDDFNYYVNTILYTARFILAPLLKDRGLYTGSSAQFCAFYNA